MINIVLWLTGAALLAVAVWRVRRPFSHMTELDQLAQNARRYESWRGGRGSTGPETTGADVMRGMLRRQVYLWVAIGIVGVVLLLAGFVMR